MGKKIERLIANDEDCKGCQYYGNFGSDRCCDFILIHPGRTKEKMAHPSTRKCRFRVNGKHIKGPDRYEAFSIVSRKEKEEREKRAAEKKKGKSA